MAIAFYIRTAGENFELYLLRQLYLFFRASTLRCHREVFSAIKGIEPRHTSASNQVIKVEIL